MMKNGGQASELEDAKSTAGSSVADSATSP